MKRSGSVSQRCHFYILQICSGTKKNGPNYYILNYNNLKYNNSCFCYKKYEDMYAFL